MVTSLIIAESITVVKLSDFLKNFSLAASESTSEFGEGLRLLNTQKPSLVYVDICFVREHYAEIKEIKANSRLILISEDITDYVEFRWLVDDCLSKSASFEEFKRSLLDCLAYLCRIVVATSQEVSLDEYFIVKGGGKGGQDFKIKFTDILFIEAYGNYIKIHPISGKFKVVAATMKASEHMLPSEFFSRVHKSRIISHFRILSLKDDYVYLKNKEQTKILIGKFYRRSFFSKEDIGKIRKN